MNSILSLTIGSMLFFFLKAFERLGINAFKICLFRTSPAEKDLGPDLSARAWFLWIRNNAGNPEGGGSNSILGPQQAAGLHWAQRIPSSLLSPREREWTRKLPLLSNPHQLETQTHTATLKSYTPAHHSTDCSPLPAKQKPEETDTWEKQSGPSSIPIF